MSELERDIAAATQATKNPMTEHQMASLIASALEEEGISQAEFARRVGVSAKHMNVVLNLKHTARPGALDYWAFMLGRSFRVSLLQWRELP